VRGNASLSMTDGIAGLHGMISNAANRVGLGFVAFEIRPKASGERQANCGDESEAEGLLKDSFHGVVRGFNNCRAAIREEGMRPQ
jgi:predicted lipid-binding transport protein (Tim44 family)